MATGKLEPFKVQDLEVEDLEAQDLEAQDLKAQGRFVSRAPVSSSFWRMAVLTAAAAIGVASQAEATIFWPESGTGFAQPARRASRQRGNERSAIIRRTDRTADHIEPEEGNKKTSRRRARMSAPNRTDRW